MPELQITLTPPNDVVRILDLAPEIMDKHLRRALQKCGLLVEADAKRRVPQASRALFRSINSRVDGQGAQLHALVNVGEPYGWFVEHGRGPGRMPPHGAGSSLALWAKSVSIISSGSNPTRLDLGILFVIARAIGRSGTRAQPFLEPAFNENKARIATIFEEAIADAVKEIQG